jgi:hypothetical protein
MEDTALHLSKTPIFREREITELGGARYIAFGWGHFWAFRWSELAGVLREGGVEGLAAAGAVFEHFFLFLRGEELGSGQPGGGGGGIAFEPAVEAVDVGSAANTRVSDVGDAAQGFDGIFLDKMDGKASEDDVKIRG